MNSKEYVMPDGKKAVFEYDHDGIGKVTIEAMDVLMGMITDRPKHYCAECKYEPIDKRCMPCSSCTNNPKNRDAFVSCEVEKEGANDE